MKFNSTVEIIRKYLTFFLLTGTTVSLGRAGFHSSCIKFITPRRGPASSGWRRYWKMLGAEKASTCFHSDSDRYYQVTPLLFEEQIINYYTTRLWLRTRLQCQPQCCMLRVWASAVTHKTLTNAFLQNRGKHRFFLYIYIYTFIYYHFAYIYTYLYEVTSSHAPSIVKIFSIFRKNPLQIRLLNAINVSLCYCSSIHKAKLIRCA